MIALDTPTYLERTELQKIYFMGDMYRHYQKHIRKQTTYHFSYKYIQNEVDEDNKAIGNVGNAFCKSLI